MKWQTNASIGLFFFLPKSVTVELPIARLNTLKRVVGVAKGPECREVEEKV